MTTSVVDDRQVGTAPLREWWQVWAERRAQWWAERPVLAQRWTRVRAVGLWAALAWAAGLFVFVPDVRLSMRAWLGCVWVVVAWWALARTKTLTWTGFMRFFAACIPWSVAIGLISTWLASSALSATVRDVGPSMGIASITEETLKLVPVALVAMLAPRRASRFAAVDWLLLGLASGTAFLLVEESLRRLTLSMEPQSLLGRLFEAMLPRSEGLPPDWTTFRPWPPLPTDWAQAGRGFGGHGVVTAIVTGLVGLVLVAVRHVRGRLDRAAQLVRTGAVTVPFVALVVAIADHAAYNGGGGLNAPDGTPRWLDPATTNVPWWIRAPWSLFGHGHFRPTVLVVLAVVLLLLDGARLARVPAATLDPRPRPGWIDRVTGALAATTRRWPAALRALPARCAFAVLGTGWVLARDWRTALAGFAPEPGQPHLAAARQGASLLAGQRAARELGYAELAGHVDVRTRRWAAVAALLTLLAGALVLAPLTAQDLERTYDLLGWLAGVMAAVASWWDSLSPAQKTAIGFGVGALLALTPLGLGGALFTTGALTWAMDKREGIATFAQDPSTATRDYLTTTPPSQMAMDGVAFVFTFLPAGAGAATGTVMRPALREAAWALRHHPGELLDSIAARIRWQLRHADEDIGAVVVQSKRLPGDPASVGWATTQQYRTTFERAYPELPMQDLVIHHAVEQQVMRRYPGLFDRYELHSIENLRGIPTHLNRDIHLVRIRELWDDFYDAFADAGRPPTKAEVLEYTTKIDDLLGHHFIPRER